MNWKMKWRTHYWEPVNMKKISLFYKFILSLAITTTAFAQGTLVVPNIYNGVEGEAYSVGIPFDDNSGRGRFQEIYASSQFANALPNGGWITAIAFRMDGGNQTVSDTFSGMEIRLSTSPRTPSNYSTIFTQNIGSDEMMVVAPTTTFTITARGARPTSPFDIRFPFEKRFFYNPGAGSLAVDFYVRGPIEFIGGVDAGGGAINPPAIAGLTGSIEEPEAFQFGNATYITQFEFEPIPEPCTITLFILGFMSAVFSKKKYV